MFVSIVSVEVVFADVVVDVAVVDFVVDDVVVDAVVVDAAVDAVVVGVVSAEESSESVDVVPYFILSLSIYIVL